jgi:diguanylate cyclase (GGDEF)-like protein
MDKDKVRFILQKNARVIYFDRSSSNAEFDSIEVEMKSFNSGYELFRQAILASNKNDLTQALKLCDEALDFGYAHSDVFLIQEISMFMGVINRSLGMPEDALKNYLNALKYGPNARTYNNIADIYLVIGDYQEAGLYLNRALTILNKKEHLGIFDKRLLNIVYTNLSETELKMGNVEASIISAKKCIEISKKIKDVFTIAFGYSLLGLAAQKQKDYTLAMEYFEKAHGEYSSCDPFSQNRVFDYIDENLRYQCECLYEWRKYNLSIELLKTLDEFVKSDYTLMIKNYEGLNDQENAYKYYQNLMDFLIKDEEYQRQNQLEHFKAKIRVFESEKKANDYELLYNHTKSISSIGKEIIAAEKLDDVLNTLYAHVDKIMDFNSLALAKIEGETIAYNWVLENNKRMDNFSVGVESKNSFSSWVVRNKKSIRLNDALTIDELKKYKEDADTIVYGHAMDSMILCPIMYKDKVYGLINVQSSESYTYSESDLEVINMLASFIAIAMRNWNVTKALKLANDQLELLSKTDALTGISNRHVLSEIVEELFKADDESNNIISVVMIDIDHFKEYNDTYGHIDGDRCLIQVVDTLGKTLDIDKFRLFRYGGDEFVAIMPFISSEEVNSILEITKRNIEKLMIKNTKSKVSDYVTCSFGFTTVQKGQLEYQRAFYLADEALYMAKAKGKNCIAFKDE